MLLSLIPFTPGGLGFVEAGPHGPADARRGERAPGGGGDARVPAARPSGCRCRSAASRISLHRRRYGSGRRVGVGDLAVGRERLAHGGGAFGLHERAQQRASGSERLAELTQARVGDAGVAGAPHPAAEHPQQRAADRAAQQHPGDEPDRPAGHDAFAGRDLLGLAQLHPPALRPRDHGRVDDVGLHRAERTERAIRLPLRGTRDDDEARRVRHAGQSPTTAPRGARVPAPRPRTWPPAGSPSRRRRESVPGWPAARFSSQWPSRSPRSSAR